METLEILHEIYNECQKEFTNFVDSLAIAPRDPETGILQFKFEDKDQALKYLELQNACLAASKSIAKWHENHLPKTQTERLDTLADNQAKDLQEFMEKHKNSKVKIILDIDGRKVSIIFELNQVNELADKFHIDIFPMMIKQLLMEHVIGSKEAETIPEIPTTI